MKLKYKKMMIMVSMCTMGIGMVTFSIMKPSAMLTTNVEKDIDTMVAFNANPVETTNDQETLSMAITEVTPVPESEAALTLAATDETTNETFLAAPLEKDANKDINKLIKNYLDAKLSGDIDKFKPLVNDATVLNIDDINRKTKYIEDYDNITCYTKKGPQEGSFVVYAYHEVKFKSIETLAPAMNEFYVVMNEKGEPNIYLGEIDDATEQFLNEVRDSEEVMDLIYNVNDKLKQAAEKDAALAEFNLKLEETAKNVTAND